MLSNASHATRTSRTTPVVAGEASGERELAATPVVEDERDLDQAEPLEELAEQPRDPELGEIRVWFHRDAMADQPAGGQQPLCLCVCWLRVDGFTLSYRVRA
jgi:hypothetical protein